jgi:DNA-binding CsgD family transcriptional regulator
MSDPAAMAPQCQASETPQRLLSPVELRILHLVSQNRTSKSIALELHVSFRTVQNHRLRICRKLGLTGYNELLRFALEHKSSIRFFPPAQAADSPLA